jgi:hypothetical protein
MTLRFLTTAATALACTLCAASASNLVTYAFNQNLDAAVQGGVTASAFLGNGGSDAIVGMGDDDGSYAYILITKSSSSVGDSVSNDQFAQFSLTAPQASGVQIAQIQFIAARAGDSTPRGVALRWSYDNYKSNLGQVNIDSTWPSTKTYRINLNAFVGGTVTFRLYAFAKEISKVEPSIRFDNLVITGSPVLYAPVVTPQTRFITTTQSSALIKGSAFASAGIARVEVSRNGVNGVYSGANGTTNWSYRATDLGVGRRYNFFIRAISNDGQVSAPVRVRVTRTKATP